MQRITLESRRELVADSDPISEALFGEPDDCTAGCPSDRIKWTDKH
jgi:hypothetical protein